MEIYLFKIALSYVHWLHNHLYDFRNIQSCLPQIYLLCVFLLLSWGYIVTFTKVLTIYQIYHIWPHPLHRSLLSSSSPIPGIVSRGIFFLFTFTCTQYLHHIHPPTPFPHILPPPTGISSPRQNLFCPLVLQSCKRERKVTFLLV
jgi:hypothetical protein